MSPRDVHEWHDVASYMDPEEGRALEELAERLAATPHPPSRGFRSRLRRRYSALIPAREWRPSHPVAIAMLLGAVGLVLLALAAFALGGPLS